nr:DNA-binding protein [Vampirovibrio sp.]
KVWVGRVEHGQDIHTAIESYCAEHKIETAWVQGLGALSKATLAYYDQVKHEYFAKDFEGEYEVLSCTGNVSLKDGKPVGHLHMTLSDTNFDCIGGHLMSGSVAVFAFEFALFGMDGSDPLTRSVDEVTGLPLWASCQIEETAEEKQEKHHKGEKHSHKSHSKQADDKTPEDDGE